MNQVASVVEGPPSLYSGGRKPQVGRVWKSQRIIVPVMERKNWHEWLNSLGMVIALGLAGVTFYYQFLRSPRELTGVVLPVVWNPDGSATLRLVLRNGGASDELVEAVYLATPESPKQQVFGTEVVRPGEAKALRGLAKLPRALVQPRTLIIPAEGGTVTLAQVSSVKEGAKLEIHVVDRSGQVLVSTVLLTVLVVETAGSQTHYNLLAPEDRAIDLLRQGAHGKASFSNQVTIIQLGTEQ
jgi:hypothetical protein